KECRFSVAGASDKGYMLIDSSAAIGLGAIMSGCKFYAAYPMTPSTAVMNFIASKAQQYGIMVEQAEDEICAINMVLGASFAGVRSMTGTSGGGFALMSEGVSLAGMMELPVVILEAQRVGPATGFPTRTEQSDLMFILHSGHGEFPRIVFAPGTPEEAFYLTNKAFDLAEKFQIPVFILIDQYLADSEWTYKSFDYKSLVYNDYRLREDFLKSMSEYKRYAYTESGVSPLAIPGDSKHLVIVDSDEHDEDGHIVEDIVTRLKMVNKRLSKKLPLIQSEMSPPVYHGAEKPDVVVTCWGSTYGVVKEAIDTINYNHSGKRIGMLHFSQIYPFPSMQKFDFIKLLEDADITICIENNSTGQFASLLRGELGYAFTHRINKFDGRPFILESLTEEIYDYIR
ncbi:MAG: 2-oxoacid:acceptor oxidoreductase subunit alpha, partial [Nitrospirae bacterium]|nr:2-oxoacid:acceptor oxidoreductase subunit alpha [Nitrospirota bacterium]